MSCRPWTPEPKDWYKISLHQLLELGEAIMAAIVTIGVWMPLPLSVNLGLESSYFCISCVPSYTVLVRCTTPKLYKVSHKKKKKN